uniref:Dual specificity protein phosphatase 15 n=3 Tax=Culex pipiens TaxID=7175 RepID=A0A8D8D5Q7_CULPI
MGNGMNKVMPGLYVGNYRDSKDYQQLERYQITHIVSIHDSPRRFHPDKHYLCVMAADTPDQNLSQYFSVCNDFIHAARLKDGCVLIHCLAGMSRSVTVAVAYIMSVTPLSWKEALKVVRTGRAIANPNLGFQNQLQEFEISKLMEERKRLKERFPSLALESNDREQCFVALDQYEVLLENKGVCEGQCKFGKDCPTGICRSESRGLRRKASTTASPKKQYNNLSTSPSSSSHLSVRSSGAAQSCPTSPRCSKALTGGGGNGGENAAQRNNPRAAGEYAAEIDMGELSELRRSASIVSTFRPRSSPAGLYSYTGSAPPSLHGSRVDLAGSAKNTGSAIYLGTNNPSGSASSPGVARRVSLRSSPRSTPESSPKASPKRSASTRTLVHQTSGTPPASPAKTAGKSNNSSSSSSNAPSRPPSGVTPPAPSNANATSTKSPAKAPPSSSSSPSTPSKLADNKKATTRQK